jgi:hypothetical protein
MTPDEAILTLLFLWSTNTSITENLQEIQDLEPVPRPVAWELAFYQGPQVMLYLLLFEKQHANNKTFSE